MPNGAEKLSEMASLHADWPILSDLEKCTRLKDLIHHGYSRRSLARAVGVSEGLIRELVKLAELNVEEREALAAGAQSRRQVLKRIQQRKVAEALGKLKLDREEFQRQVLLNAEAFECWIKDLDIAGGYLERLMNEFITGPYGIRHREFANQASKVCEIPLQKDPRQIIEDCTPEGGNPASGPEFLNRCFIWYARWAERSMPSAKLRDTVASFVARRLRQTQSLTAVG
jgi:hypothetical protein